MQTEFTPISGLVGGVLIGLAAILLLLANGRIAGISGIVGGLLTRATTDMGWRIAFVVGLWLGALVYWLVRGELFAVELAASWSVVVTAGVLVGFGARMAAGCTSGHAVCGIALLSKRSIAATLVFMGVGIVTVFVTRHVFS